jgi:SAM-dependent methyltransferase
MTSWENPPHANTPEEKRLESRLFSNDYYTEETFHWWVAHPYRHHTLRHLSNFLRQAGIDTRDELKVIEPACGCGVNLTNLSKDFPHFQYYGIDLSLEGASVGNRWGVGRYLAADAEDMPFRSETFDICLCVAAIHHFHRNPERFLKEVYRVLKGNGLIYIFEPDVNLTLNFFDKLKERLLKFKIKRLNENQEFTAYGVIPAAPTEGPFNRTTTLEILEALGIKVVIEGYSEYMTEWARHFPNGFDLAVKFDMRLKPEHRNAYWNTGGAKYFAIARKP